MLGVAVLVAFAPLAHAGTCSNAQINQAFTAVILRPPNGSGTSGECNPALYGSYTSLNDLEKKIVAYVNSHPSTPAPAPAPAAAASPYHLDGSYNIVDSGNRIVARAGTYNLIGEDGASLTAQKAASLIGQDGAGLTAGRSAMGVGSKPVFVVSKRR
jgi:hypothetical protein